MAYVSQEMKSKLAPHIKTILNKYGIKGTLSVNNHSTLVLNIKSGTIDFIENYIETGSGQRDQDRVNHVREKKSLSVNVYWCHEHFNGKAKQFLEEMILAMKGPDFFDHSDIMTDYFHRSHYIDINIGRWNKPYELTN